MKPEGPNGGELKMARDGDGQEVQQYNRKHLAILEKIIDKASSDAAWKQKLLSDPQAAFDEAGLLPEIDSLNPATWEGDEVTGQAMYIPPTWQGLSCPWTGIKPISSA